MLKSNNKIVIERVRNYIKECIDIEDLKGNYNKEVNENNCFIVVNEIMKDETRYSYNEDYVYRNRITKQDIFRYWLQGVSCLRVDLDTPTQRKLLMEWLEETEAEAEKFDCEAVENKFHYLIYKEFSKMLEKQQKEMEKKQHE